jgi:polar amino acid transport system permease protein
LLIAGGSTALVVALTVWLVPKTEGWQKVREAFFSWPDFKDAIARIWRPFLYDVQIFLICVPLILIAGMLVASARSVRAPALFPLRFGARLYTDIVRGVPVILWITLIGFGIPGLLQTREWYTRPVVLGAATLVMVYSAYVSEVIRAGIESVHESQRAAARSLGLSSGQTMRSVVLPQAVRRVVPALMNDFVSLQKDVALISLLGPVEALRRATTIQQRTFNFTPYVAAAVLFLCVSVPLTRLTDYLLAKQRREMSGTAVR